MGNNNYNSELDLKTRFLDYLIKQKAYPPNSFLKEYVLGSINKRLVYRPDLVIVELENSIPLAIIEFRFGEIDRKKEMELLRIARGTEDINGSLPAYLVTDISKEPGFNLALITTSKTIPGKEPTIKPIEPSDFPTYEQLKMARKVRDEDERRDFRKKTIDSFQWICYSLALIVAGAFVWSFYREPPISIVQLWLLVAALAMFVLPHAAKLRMLGIEFERRKPGKNP